MIVLDANVLIAYFDDSDIHHEATLRLLSAHSDEEFCASALTIAESLIYPTLQGTQRLSMGSLEKIGVEVRPFTKDAILDLARVRATSGLRMPDAVVLHAAMDSGARLATFDSTLAAAAAKVGVETVEA